MPAPLAHQIRRRARHHRRSLTGLPDGGEQVCQVGQDLRCGPGGGEGVDADGEVRGVEEARETAAEAEDTGFGGCWGRGC